MKNETATGWEVEHIDGDALSTGLRQRKKDATYQAIGDAAWQLFAEQGYAETSINDIAARANVAPRTFFRYFPTKEAVMYPEFEQSLQRVRAAFYERPADEPVMTSLIHAMESLTESMTEDTHRNQARLHMMKQANDPSVGDYFRRKLTEQVEDMIRVRDAALPDVDLRARLASGIVGLIMDTSREHWLETGAADNLPDIGQHCMSLVLEMLGPRT